MSDNLAKPFDESDPHQRALMKLGTMRDDSRRLPSGKTCAECGHYDYCRDVYNCAATIQTKCYWAPSGFCSSAGQARRGLATMVKEERS
jgi:hypothetical protein